MQDNLLRPDLISLIGIAELAGKSIATMRQYRRFGLLPDPLVGGGSGNPLLWHRTDAEAWVQANSPSAAN